MKKQTKITEAELTKLINEAIMNEYGYGNSVFTNTTQPQVWNQYYQNQTTPTPWYQQPQYTPQTQQPAQPQYTPQTQQPARPQVKQTKKPVQQPTTQPKGKQTGYNQTSTFRDAQLQKKYNLPIAIPTNPQNYPTTQQQAYQYASAFQNYPNKGAGWLKNLNSYNNGFINNFAIALRNILTQKKQQSKAVTNYAYNNSNPQVIPQKNLYEAIDKVLQKYKSK